MAYENIEYWKKENWEELFSKFFVLASKNNIVTKIRTKLKGEWEEKSVEEIFAKKREFFLPEIEKTEEEEKRVKPWVLKFFGVEFKTKDNMPVDYDGILFRVEEGVGLADVKISLSYTAPFTYFETLAKHADKIIEFAQKKGFEIKEEYTEEIELNSPEDVRREIASLLEKVINLTMPRNALMFFVWSLSNSAPESYARKVYGSFNDDLVFNKLDFSKEPNFGLISVGGYDTLSRELFDFIRDTASIEKYEIYSPQAIEVLNLLGIENPPTPMKDYFEEAFKSFKEGNFETTKNFIRKLGEVANTYASGWSYYFGRYSKLDSLAKTLNITKGDVLRGFAPLLFLGILKYEYGEIKNFERWEEEWKKL